MSKNVKIELTPAEWEAILHAIRSTEESATTLLHSQTHPLRNDPYFLMLSRRNQRVSRNVIIKLFRNHPHYTYPEEKIRRLFKEDYGLKFKKRKKD